jgi:hypothetical protein
LGRAAHGYAALDWWANFFPIGIAYSVFGGSAWEPTPWRAVQRAAWGVLGKEERWVAARVNGWQPLWAASRTQDRQGGG